MACTGTDNLYCVNMTTARALVRDELLVDLETVTTRIVEAIRDQIPAYDVLATTQLGEVRHIAAWGVGRVLEAWVADTALTEADLTRFRGIGAARAMDGRPLLGVLRAYRIAGVEVTDLVAERAAGRLTVDDAIALARLWMASIDALSEALYGGHSEVVARLTEDPDRALTDLLDDLLKGRNATTAAVGDRARQLGLELPTTLTLTLGTSPRGADDLTSWHRALTRATGNRGPLLHGVREGVLVAISGELDRHALAREADAYGWKVVLHVGRAEAMAHHHRGATMALREAPSRAWDRGSVLDEVDVALLNHLRGHAGDTTAVLRRRLADPLRDHPTLQETVEAILRAGSAAGAAQLLGCHVQTVRHRTGRIRALTGRDVRLPWDRLALEIASLVCHTQ